jgi:hypothetical protein
LGIAQEIIAAFEFAENSAFPDKSEAVVGEYAQRIQREVACVD